MARRYKYSKSAGAVQDAMVQREAEPPIQQAAELSQPLQVMSRQALNVFDVDTLEEEDGDESIAPQKSIALPSRRRRVRSQTRTNVASPPEPPRAAPPPTTGRDPHVHPGVSTMFFHTVAEGQRVLVTDRSGKVEVVEGPRRFWSWGKKIQAMIHYVAHPGEFLIVRFRDGKQEHLAGPNHCWLDPRIHTAIEKEEAVQIAAKEAVVVYSEGDGDGSVDQVSRRIAYGPATFVPEPGEWLHTFRWHGPSPEVGGFQKVPGAMVFQKLWLMPDQMYHDVVDVRTADDAVLTIRLMLFYELIDIEQMLSATHDPIGDFVNAATSDVIDFVGRLTLDRFKAQTEALNRLETYRQLTDRAQQSGYKIDKIVYRGYGAPPALQRLHDEATESRVRLQLERATEQQAQELEDFKLDRRLERASKEREQAAAQALHDLQLAQKRQDAARAASRLDAEQTEVLTAAQQARHRQHLTELAALGVDLTALLTRGAADQTIEVRGGGTPHLHLDRSQRRGS